MTAKEMKEHAQSELLSAMQTAFDRLEDDRNEILIAVMSKQMARVEKLFGFEENSFSRGA